MRTCHSLVSPTWGMHQYSADVAVRTDHLVTHESLASSGWESCGLGLR